MAWLRWRQHKADRAESLSIRTYLARRDGHLALYEIIVDARRRADAHWRLDVALEHIPAHPAAVSDVIG